MKIIHGSLSVRVYQSLKDGLIEGSYEPGQRLTLQDLADTLGTSITPVREACLRLVSEAALELRSGRFVIVPEMKLERYLQIRAIRIALESLAARLAAAHASEDDIAELARLHNLFVESERAGNHRDTRRYNRDFHFHIYRLSEMPMLVSQIENLWASMGPILRVYYTRVTHDYAGGGEHENLLRAFAIKDAEAAGQAIARDIERGGESLIRYLS